jgi:transcriptional regulator with XRE-family HTH domain
MIGLELIVKVKNMEYKDVANFLKISPQTVSDWINGRRRVPPKRAIQLSEILGVDNDLISKEVNKDDELKIYYQLGKVYDSIGIRKEIAQDLISEDIGEEYGNNMESYEQLSLLTVNDDVSNKGTIKDLEDQIADERKELKTETLDISISELSNMYSVRNVIDIHPEFQRLFRWTMSQKTKLIESILLGIPIPPLFVAEDARAAWDVIDGVQRLSTIFEFLGLLKDESDELIDPSVLVGTDKLEALEGKVWDNKHPKHKHRFSFQEGLGLTNKFLNAKLKVIVVGNESNPNAKYDIFDRLNTGGSKLTPQEIRNCLAIMINREYYSWMRKLSLNPDFVESIPISDKALSEQNDLEYVLRFIVYRYIKKNEYSFTDDIHEVLTKKLRSICTENNLDLVKEKEIFDKTFKLLNNALGKNAFKKYFSAEKRFKGQVMLSSFEIIAIGIANNLEAITNLANPAAFVYDKVTALYNSREYSEAQNIISGRAVTRFTTLTELGKEYFRI